MGQDLEKDAILESAYGIRGQSAVIPPRQPIFSHVKQELKQELKPIKMPKPTQHQEDHAKGHGQPGQVENVTNEEPKPTNNRPKKYQKNINDQTIPEV